MKSRTKKARLHSLKFGDRKNTNGGTEQKEGTTKELLPPFFRISIISKKNGKSKQK